MDWEWTLYSSLPIGTLLIGVFGLDTSGFLRWKSDEIFETFPCSEFPELFWTSVCWSVWEQPSVPFPDDLAAMSPSGFSLVFSDWSFLLRDCSTPSFASVSDVDSGLVFALMTLALEVDSRSNCSGVGGRDGILPSTSWSLTVGKVCKEPLRSLSGNDLWLPAVLGLDVTDVWLLLRSFPVSGDAVPSVCLSSGLFLPLSPDAMLFLLCVDTGLLSDSCTLGASALSTEGGLDLGVGDPMDGASPNFLSSGPNTSSIVPRFLSFFFDSIGSIWHSGKGSFSPSSCKTNQIVTARPCFDVRKMSHHSSRTLLRILISQQTALPTAEIQLF